MKYLLTIGACLAIAVPAAAQTTPPTAPPPAPPVAVAPVPPVPPAPVFAPIPAPDYTSDAGWLCRPGRKDACAVDQDVTVIAANGKRKIERFKPEPAPTYDCFYVYPTVSLDPTPNSDLNIGDEERRVAASQAARFTSKCRVFAPLYRQVTLTALRDFMAGKPTTADRKLAFLDVQAAWYDYLKRDNGGRGVVLIGHSQGALVLKQLLADVIEKDRDMRRNLIAAYLLGANVAVPPGGDVGGDFKTTRLCKSMQQFGCVVTYTTFRADSPPPVNSRFARVDMPGMVAACTNPAALGGGRAVTDAIFATSGAGLGSTPMGQWTTDGAAVTTPFVSVPGLISAECVSNGGFNYLAVTVNADPADPRTDTIVGDVVVNGTTLKDWGLHLIDMPVEMGNLVTLSEYQAAAWRGIPMKEPKR
ncbi:DUF3089 domain-containing protein [Sphingomonas sp.]|jgi:hypothetical protein|uniref:DUF3089 domain-containing protein n=1 Tax=Sphingomonas sp. TaxID=28214 RepID=UPI002E33171A|nr:DUF3089 domain-containing protein [Sphingomonas sp.]HEX4695464.1 DUF3089 domain-containing protein [Sphingomonas sp.]